MTTYSDRKDAGLPDEPHKTRVEAGLTQVQAAATIGASVRSWQEWEGGRRVMPTAKFQLFQFYLFLNNKV